VSNLPVLHGSRSALGLVEWYGVGFGMTLMGNPVLLLLPPPNNFNLRRREGRGHKDYFHP